MDINATIIGQFITFAILVWFTTKYVWPPILNAISEREKKIASGLEAAERSKRELEMTEHKALSIIREAKREAGQIIEQANLHSAKLVEDAKSRAHQESQRIVDMAQGEIEREVTRTKAQMKSQLATLAVSGAEKIIKRHLDQNTHNDLLNDLVAEI